MDMRLGWWELARVAELEVLSYVTSGSARHELEFETNRPNFGDEVKLAICDQLDNISNRLLSIAFVTDVRGRLLVQDWMKALKVLGPDELTASARFGAPGSYNVGIASIRAEAVADSTRLLDELYQNYVSLQDELFTYDGFLARVACELIGPQAVEAVTVFKVVARDDGRRRLRRRRSG